MMPGLSEKFDDDDERYYDLKSPVVALKEGLPVKELLDKHQTEFEIKPDDDEEDRDGTVAESCFEFGDIERVINLDMIDVEEGGGDETPFDRYRRKMFDISDDGKVKKYVVKRGVGPVVPANSVVFIRYQAYLEYSEVPFDSTLWQCSGEGDLPVQYNLAKGQLIPGLYEAVLTMRKGEKAEILIHPDMAYGMHGCPPRIPSEATVLFIVEVDRFVECGDVIQDQDHMDMYERKEYRNVYKVAKGHYMLGNELFKLEKYRDAVNKYRLVINMLHNARLMNEEEEKERNHFLIKNYTNSCICYKKLKNYKRICIMAADAMSIDEKEVFKNSKLLYFWGYAKMMLGDFSTAKDRLLKAQRLRPQDSEISSALKELETKKNNALQQERIMMRRAFGNNVSSVTVTEVDEVEEDFRRTVQDELERFANNPDRDSMYIKEHKFTSQEEKIYLNVAIALGLYARVADGEKRIIHIRKRNE